MFWQLPFLYFFLAALVVDAAPAWYGIDHASLPDKSQQKRQIRPLDILLTETLMVVFSETETETTTEVLTTTESLSSAASTGTSTFISSQSAVTLRPEVQFVGEVPDPASDAAGVSFLPITNYLPSLSVEQTATSSASSTPTAISSDVTGSPAAISSAETSSADQNANLPSATGPEPPTETDSTATDTDTSSGSTASPAFALHQPTVTGPLVSAYYPDWVSATLPPENIDMTRFDWIDFAFVIPDQKFRLAFDDPSSSPDILKRLVSAAHAKGTKVKVSIGGWSGSRYFSPACATSSSRQTFVNNIVALYKQYNLDGIDIDWEYPGIQGAGNNVVSPQDSMNFLAMLKLLRTSLPSTARITAATQDVPFADANGNPMKDVSAFAAVLDWINIMNYDIFQSSSTPGPNSPLSDACHNTTQPGLNAASAINAWASAKFPASRLMLGVPAYGYVNPSHATHLVSKRSMSAPRLASKSHLYARDNDAQTPTIVTVKGDGGEVQFNDLIAQGALLNTPTNGYIGFGGFTRFYDSCSSTPFLTSPYTNQVITYDDPQSLKLKAQLASQSGILGTSMWDLSGDTATWDLTNALRQGLGKSG